MSIRATNAGASRVRARRPWAVPAAVAASLTVLVVLYLLNPGLHYQLNTLSSAIKSESAQSIKIWANVVAGRSPLALAGLAAWSVLAVPLSPRGVLVAAADMFGPLAGITLTWLGLALGAVLLGALARALTSWSWRGRTAGAESPAARWVVLGLRLIPGLPQDVVSALLGVWPLPWRDLLWSAALSATVSVGILSVGQYAPNLELAIFWLLTLTGVGILAAVLWLHRGRLPARRISASQRNQAIATAGVLAALYAVYRLVPSVNGWVDNALRAISGNPAGVAEYLRGFGATAALVSGLLMVLQSVMAPLPAFIITFANGMIWGFLGGAALSWSTAMLGAALCYWIARWLGRPAVERLVGGSSSLEVADLFFERYGDRTILVARLLPFVSFDLISYAAGLTSMGFWRFFIATGIGQLPATLVYSYLASVGGAATSIKVLLYVFIATAVLLVVGSALRPWFMARLRAGRAHAEAVRPEGEVAHGE